MITERDLDWIFGRNVALSPDLLDAVLKFTLAFSYAEHKLMGGRSSAARANDYAVSLLDRGDFEFDRYARYFQNRYTREAGFEEKLTALCNGDGPSFIQINSAFSGISSKLNQLEALLRVCIRLRNNLFHGEKWSYMLRDQEANLNMATDFIVDVLRHSGE